MSVMTYDERLQSMKQARDAAGGTKGGYTTRTSTFSMRARYATQWNTPTSTRS